MGASATKVDVSDDECPKVDVLKLFPPSEDFSFINAEYKVLCEEYLATVLGPNQTHIGSYNKQLLRAGMVILVEILYDERAENRALDTLVSTEYRDEDALKVACAWPIDVCATALCLDSDNKIKFQSNFDSFLDIFIQRQKDMVAKKVIAHMYGIPIKQSDTNESFTGSLPHLLFGRIVGDALGLHAVFGALLNPTGGVVGAENSSCFLRCIGNGPTLNRHALGHDAFGYLLSYHNRGPGYAYLELRAIGVCGSSSKTMGRTDPLGGQLTGVYWWTKYRYGTCPASFMCCCLLPWLLYRSYPNSMPAKKKSNGNHKDTKGRAAIPLQFNMMCMD
jgi:hypothetical protein